MNAKNSVFVACVEVIMYLLLHILHEVPLIFESNIIISKMRN